MPYVGHDQTAYIAHHGVKGMKWGVIRRRDPVKKAARRHKKYVRQDAQTLYNAKKYGGAYSELARPVTARMRKDPAYAKEVEARFERDKRVRRGKMIATAVLQLAVAADMLYNDGKYSTKVANAVMVGNGALTHPGQSTRIAGQFAKGAYGAAKYAPEARRMAREGKRIAESQAFHSTMKKVVVNGVVILTGPDALGR